MSRTHPERGAAAQFVVSYILSGGVSSWYWHSFCPTCHWTTGGENHKYCAYGHGPLAPIEELLFGEIFVATYVTHTCKNEICGRAFNAPDETGATTIPPKWRYCPDCEEVFGKSVREVDPAKQARMAEVSAAKKKQQDDLKYMMERI